MLTCITTQHDLHLVALAACLCGVASLATLALLARSETASSRVSIRWMVAAASLFGAGAWSLHFLAMLAYLSDLPITYDVPNTVVSIVIAITGTIFAFTVLKMSRSRLVGALAGGLTLGVTVCAMHYVGIGAMRLGGTLILREGRVAASILFCIVFTVLALTRASRLGSVGRRIEVAIWLTIGVCGVHFIGMSALVITPGQRLSLDGAMLGSRAMGMAVGSVGLAVLLLSIGAAVMEQHLATRAITDLDRLRTLGNLSHEVMIIHRHGIVLEINSAGERLFNVPLDRLLGSRLVDLFEDRDDIHAILARERSGPGALGSDELTARRADGHLIPVDYTSSKIDYGGTAAMALALRDLSDLRRNEERIRHLAHHDALTELPNRMLLTDRLGHALDTAAREGGSVAVLYLDLDRFKPVNDLLGHAAGDALLVQVARRLRSVLRRADTLARVGGDEFVILSTLAVQPERAGDLAGRIVGALERPFDLEGRQIEIGVSIGIALYPADGATRESLFRAADTALYRVKNEKRGTFRFYEPTMDANLHDRHQLEQDLRHAVERGELELHYQPIVRCGTLMTEAYEALVRWRHPARGLVSPADFIPLAEETGQIDGIGKWVIETACMEAAGWADECKVAVNVSAMQLRRSDLALIVGGALTASGFDPLRLEVEVTESVFMNDSKQALKALTALRDQGVSMSLDDFGTGYSSLSYLRSFAFNKIKIDKSFMSGLGHTDEATAIVRAIIGLAHTLAMTVVAEGVETVQQLRLLQAEGCDYVQGFLLGRPERQPVPFTPAEALPKPRPNLVLVAAPRPHVTDTA